MRKFKTQLLRVQAISKNYLLLTMKRPIGFHYLAGQYIHLILKDEQGSFERIYSIASPPSSQALEFCIQTSGDGRGVKFFKNFSHEQTVVLSEPRGEFQIQRVDRPLIFMAGGSGLSPIRSFLHDLLSQSLPSLTLKLLYGCQEASEIPWKQELLDLADQSSGKLKVFLTAEVGQSFGVEPGRVDQLLLNHPELIYPKADYYLCGPSGMIQVLIQILSQCGILEDQVFMERFS